ncbi:sensor histidine kinase [Chryseosolibacter indicus]|uniref:histidine kinase n=1 Tax=Chryseosolibacter indicus TaxID=2782351 RepID=A0ABS5VWW2_9BACT|nr:histidine kinase [Chryseosolibacter indicus]MBT1704491.1 histidine kinase [Chryseosolibacter indicus]
MEREVVFVATVTLVVLVAMIIILFVIFQSKKNKYIIKQLEAEQKMEQEIAKSQMEIQEQSLKNIGWELHDNIGQLLAVAKMQLSILSPKLPDQYRNNVKEINTLIADSLQEIRLLSKTLNPEVILNLGLVKSIECELERFNKLNFLKAQLTVSGEEVKLAQKDEIILFRILQEFFSNSIKHSRAGELNVLLEYHDDYLMIKAKDNGVGFNDEGTMEKGGSGLINMRSRAQLIGAIFTINSAVNEGVCLSLCYTYRYQDV